MGPGRPAGAVSIDTRERVLDAACRCFAQYGYGPATNNLIAEIAGVTAGSVYYHFGSKSNLFDAVCEYVYGRIVTRCAEALVGAHSVQGLLQTLLAEAMRINHEAPELAGFVATAAVDARRHPELGEAFARQADRMTDVLFTAVAAGQQRGLIPSDLEPSAVAAVISAIVDGFAQAAASTEVPEMDRMTELFDRLLLRSGEPG